MARRMLAPVSRNRAGSFSSLHGAMLAVTRLIQLRHEPSHVAIVPRDYRVEPPEPLRTTAWRGMRRGAVITAVACTVLWAVVRIGAAAIVAAVPLLGLTVLFGALAGCVLALGQRKHASASDFGVEWGTLEPHAFDVVVSDGADEAAHELAGWWNPDAPPAPWQQPA